MSVFDPLNQPYGATPIEEEDRQYLLPPHRRTQAMSDLNDLEGANINRARFWVRDEALGYQELLTYAVQCDVHQRMFDEVWEWAGQIRDRELTIGVDPARIRLDWMHAIDAAYWMAHRTYSPAATILRLHHKTVQIHPFHNGNGRHARLVADELAFALELGDDVFSWGAHLGVDYAQQRLEYLKSLRALDENRNDVGPLLAFALDPATDDTWR